MSRPIASFAFGARQFAQTTGRIRDRTRPEPTTPRTAYLLPLLAVLRVAVLVFMVRNPADAGDEQPTAPLAPVG